jgi:hypothetical protein
MKTLYQGTSISKRFVKKKYAGTCCLDAVKYPKYGSNDSKAVVSLQQGVVRLFSWINHKSDIMMYLFHIFK